MNAFAGYRNVRNTRADDWSKRSNRRERRKQRIVFLRFLLLKNYGRWDLVVFTFPPRLHLTLKGARIHPPQAAVATGLECMQRLGYFFTPVNSSARAPAS
jgi:hypothetical protein